jgi:hypothetical protein
MKFVFPHFEEKNLDRWTMASRDPPMLQGGVSRPSQDLVLAEALQRFHIASSKNQSKSGSLTISLPPILLCSNANTWLSTRGPMRTTTSGSSVDKSTSCSSVAVDKSNTNDLTKWLAGSSTQTNDNISEDFSKWLKKSVPAGSSESSLPGKRVEFPDIPLSAFRRNNNHQSSSNETSSVKTESLNDKWLKNPHNKWLAAPTPTSSQPMDVEEEDEDDLLANQWLLVERNIRQSEPMTSGSIEAWLMAAASVREPSIVVIPDDDEDDDFTSGFSVEF